MNIDDKEMQRVFALLRHLDHPAPDVSVAAVVAAARARARPWVRWAAAIALALAVAGGAYALPGSPLKTWVQKVTRRAAASRGQDTTRGIALTPGPDFLVRFTRPQPMGRIHVLLTDGADVEVHAVTGSAGFSAGTDTLTVDNWDSGATFEVRIPRATPRVQVMVGDTRIWPTASR